MLNFFQSFPGTADMDINVSLTTYEVPRPLAKSGTCKWKYTFEYSFK